MAENGHSDLRNCPLTASPCFVVIKDHMAFFLERPMNNLRVVMIFWRLSNQYQLGMGFWPFHHTASMETRF